MGTDITMHYEVLKDGEWRPLDTFVKGADGRWEECQTFEPCVIERNYKMFASLMGRAFRGFDEMKRFKKHSGLPEDVSPEVRDSLDHWWMHDVGWLTLRELQEWPHWDDATDPDGWTKFRSHKEECAELWKAVLLFSGSNPDEVRFVFGFDS